MTVAIVLVASACTVEPSDEPSQPCLDGDTDGQFDPVGGCWISSSSVGSDPHEMYVKADSPAEVYSGTAVIYFYAGDELYFAEFTLGVARIGGDETGDGTGDTGGTGDGGGEGSPPMYEIRFQCGHKEADSVDEKGCAEVSFTATCTIGLDEGLERMVCTGDGAWENFPLVWIRQNP
jgi:hypothetical protein